MEGPGLDCSSGGGGGTETETGAATVFFLGVRLLGVLTVAGDRVLEELRLGRVDFLDGVLGGSMLDRYQIGNIFHYQG